MPRFWYNSNNSSPEDAVRNEVEIDAIVAYLFANGDKHEFAVSEPAARRREGGRDDRQVDRLPRLSRGRRRLARRGRTAPHVRSAAREHRQQDELRVDLQLGPRSEALQPGDVHAGSAADGCAGGRCRDVSVDAQRARRRRREGDAGSAGGRHGPARLSQGGDAVRGCEGDDGQVESAAEADSSWGSARSTATAASAATTSRASRRRSRSAPTCPKRAASSSRGSISRS